MRGGWLYIMTNRPDGALHTGVTSDIACRAFERREGPIDGFTLRYGLKRLVLTEFYEDIRDAIQREGNIKHSPRALKVRLIHAANSDRCNLYEDLNAGADEKDVDGREKLGHDGRGAVGDGEGRTGRLSAPPASATVLSPPAFRVGPAPAGRTARPSASDPLSAPAACWRRSLRTT